LQPQEITFAQKNARDGHDRICMYGQYTIKLFLLKEENDLVHRQIVSFNLTYLLVHRLDQLLQKAGSFRIAQKPHQRIHIGCFLFFRIRILYRSR